MTKITIIYSTPHDTKSDILRLAAENMFLNSCVSNRLPQAYINDTNTWLECYNHIVNPLENMYTIAKTPEQDLSYKEQNIYFILLVAEILETK